MCRYVNPSITTKLWRHTSKIAALTAEVERLKAENAAAEAAAEVGRQKGLEEAIEIICENCSGGCDWELTTETCKNSIVRALKDKEVGK